MTSFSRFFLRLTRTPGIPTLILPSAIRNPSPKSAFCSPPRYFASGLVNMALKSEQFDLPHRLKPYQDSIPSYPNCHPDVNTVDVYRAHLTSLLTKVTGVDATIIYPALAWTQTLEKGDLVLPVPALRVKSKKPAELAAEWAEKVGPVDAKLH